MRGETDTGSDHKYVEDKVDVSILQISCCLLLKIHRNLIFNVSYTTLFPITFCNVGHLIGNEAVVGTFL